MEAQFTPDRPAWYIITGKKHVRPSAKHAARARIEAVLNTLGVVNKRGGPRGQLPMVLTVSCAVP